MTDELITVWTVGTTLTAVAGAFCIGLGAMDYEGRRYRETKRMNARMILRGMGFIVTSWAWPAVLVVVLAVCGPKLINMLLKDAEISTLAERREARRLSREQILKDEALKREKVIEELEQELRFAGMER